MTENQVAVAEQFYSIQGEGPNAGAPAVFLRLAHCNLSCGWEDSLDEYEPGDEPQGDAEWVCDTINVWREPDGVYEPDALVQDWDNRGWLDRFRDDVHLVLTGGEPTLPGNQKAFIALMDAIPATARPYTEVETNGTIVPEGEFTADVDLYNVSVKLSNSGMSDAYRINPDAIRHYIMLDEGVRDKFVRFKFVVGSWDNVEEIEELIDEQDIPESMVSIMPAGQTQEQLRETYPMAAEIAKAKNWAFSPRLQVDTWNQATGV